MFIGWATMRLFSSSRQAWWEDCTGRLLKTLLPQLFQCGLPHLQQQVATGGPCSCVRVRVLVVFVTAGTFRVASHWNWRPLLFLRLVGQCVILRTCLVRRPEVHAPALPFLETILPGKGLFVVPVDIRRQMVS